MKVSDLISQLQACDPEAEVITGIWNGYVDTYTVLDSVRQYPYDAIYNDFFGTPDPFDDRLLHLSDFGNVVYLGSNFDNNPAVTQARRHPSDLQDNELECH